MIGLAESKRSIMDAAAGAAAAAGDVFQLYQPGLTPDHVLQLCYLRRRAPIQLRLERTRVENDFVLPRPELKIASVLPAIDIPLEQLLGAATSRENTNNKSATIPPTGIALIHAKQTAKKYLLQPRLAALEDVRQWSALTESDWLEIHRSLQRPKKQQLQDDNTTGLTPLPDVADVCWLLEQCPSDAFASFVWDHLLISLLQEHIDLTTSNTSSTLLRLLSLLAHHHSLASLSPKDFRAKVRARNLRQVDETFGAQAELALVGFYRKQRTT